MISVQLINANLHKIQLKVSLVKERGKEEEAKEEEEEEEGVEKVEGESMKKIYDCSSTSQSPPPAISDLKSEYITRSNNYAPAHQGAQTALVALFSSVFINDLFYL